MMAIACDLDGTLAHYDGWKGADHIGSPIMRTLSAVKRALAAGHDVWIFTARAAPDAPDRDAAIAAVKRWCIAHVGTELGVTAIKWMQFSEFWDDKAVAIEKNTGDGITFNPSLWERFWQ